MKELEDLVSFKGSDFIPFRFVDYLNRTENMKGYNVVARRSFMGIYGYVISVATLAIPALAIMEFMGYFLSAPTKL